MAVVSRHCLVACPDCDEPLRVPIYATADSLNRPPALLVRDPENRPYVVAKKDLHAAYLRHVVAQ